MNKTSLRTMLLILLITVFSITSTAITSNDDDLFGAISPDSSARASPPTASTHANAPVKLAVILSPSKVLADSSSKSYAVAVQIQDAFGNPALATRSTVVELLSSNETVGTVSASVTISSGWSTAYATFTSTYAPGTTTISAHSALLTSGSAVMTTVGAVASKLAVILAPSKLSNDSSSHSYAVAVQIQDSDGNPALATRNTVVLLFSSNETVGTVPDSVTINAYSTTTYVTFYSTYTAGSTTIRAFALGLAPGSAVMTTTTGLAPTKLAVILGPSKLPNDNYAHYYPVKVQLQDVNGDPAKSGEKTDVTLTSSNETVGTVPNVTISAGRTYASTWFATTYAPGWTTINATADGYTSGSAVMRTIGAVASKLAVILGPSKLRNDNYGYYYPVKVQLQDVYGNPAKAPDSTTVTLTSSDETVGTVPGSVTISKGKTYASTWFTTTHTPGWTTINATASPYASGSANMTTVGAVPSELAVILAPSKVLNNSASHYYAVKVQLRDADGNPAKAPTSTEVVLTSSNTLVGTVASPITISAGRTYAYTSFTSTYKPGSTRITASATGYTSGSAVMTTVTGLTPTKLAVILGPARLPNDHSGRSYSVAVQLQDAKGAPTPAPRNTVVWLTSSNEKVGTVPASVTIYSGWTTTFATFTTTYEPGLTTITASTVVYSSGSAPMATGRWYLGISVYTDKYIYTKGDTMYVGLNVSNPGAATDVSIKVWLELRTGATYTVLDVPSVTLPAGLSYSNPNQWSFKLPSISTGKYRWHAVLGDPASGAILSEDTAVWTYYSP